MKALVLLACLTLAACGADGAPEPPAKAGVAISGEVGVGLVMR